MAKLVSKTYGDALFEVALEKNQLDEFLDEVKAAQTAIEENKELFKLMSHPKIVKEEKIKVDDKVWDQIKVTDSVSFGYKSTDSSKGDSTATDADSTKDTEDTSAQDSSASDSAAEDSAE